MKLEQNYSFKEIEDFKKKFIKGKEGWFFTGLYFKFLLFVWCG